MIFNFFFRAIRINSTKEELNLEFNRIEMSLLSLGYPHYLIKKQKEKALNHNSIKKVETVDSKKDIFLVFTRDEVTSGKNINTQLNQIIDILGNSPFFKNVQIKRSFRQQPSLASKLIMNISSHKNTEPVPCREKACKICNLLYVEKEWTSNITVSYTHLTLPTICSV